MNLLPLLFGLFMLLFGLFALIAIPCILWFQRKRSWRFRIGWSIAACLPLLAVMWAWSALTTYDPEDPEELARGFAFELHQPWERDVQALQNRRVTIGDGVASWVRFETTPQLVETLIAGFAPSDWQTFYTGREGPNVPSWWQPEADGITQYYYTEGWEKGCSTFSFAYLAHDPGKRIVYFHHSGS